MMFYLLSLIGFLSVGAFGVINTNGFEGVQSAAVVLFSIVNLLCMFFMSEAGDQLALQSGSVAAPLVHGPWYECSPQFRKSLVLVLQRVNTRVQACVIGVPSMPLSCTTFTWVIKTLVSLYLFMVEVQEVKKA
ncbi:uncharacterized protein LOC128985237 isoform X2 [Macrosteles quadrilineatus]|uniref:uncharacterized protein LOC128982132 isoform X2 n=1 Tax=Macrosteles quadrilineatus TaxID=74068 RepID=UPI0023E1BE2F|nr:uncharacterized protein LOC128982132 isoform X2 [Macrosteles quadrilineatus]XP_054260604.1 uncharacterized protein LOC128985237 isoform X2 [Macrosteles quadrilineatus]